MQDLFELIRKYRWAVTSADTEAALEAVINRISPEIYLFVLGRVSESAAEDIRSKALREIAKSLPTFGGASSAEAWGWCHEITKRQISKFYKAEETQRTVAMDPSLLAELIDAGVGGEMRSGDEDAIRGAVQEALRILEKSDPDCFLLLWDRFIVGMTFPEMGTDRKKKSSTVRMQTNECLEKIEPFLT